MEAFALPQQPKARKRNPHWDALVKILGYEPKTQSEIKLWGKLSHSFKLAGATPESMEFAAKEYKKEFPRATLTAAALEKHYSHCSARYEKKRQIVNCPECGIGGGYHLSDCPTKQR
jgi:hypothetical protein